MAKIIGESIKDVLECPYCGSSDIWNVDDIKGSLIHQWLSCRKCGRNFEAKEDGKKFSIINGDTKYGLMR